jgi:hypothetical protein
MQAETLGSRVPRTKRTGRVEAVFSNACNVLLEDGRLVTLLGRRAGNVAHGIRLSGNPGFEGMLTPGTAAWLDGDRLSFGDGAIVVTLASARTWRSGLRPGICRSGRKGKARLRVRELLLEQAARCESDFLCAALGTQQRDTPLAKLVAAILPQLAAASQAGDCDAASALLARLVGLGPGLTPAGDDFIVGWLAGLTLEAGASAGFAFLRAMRARVAQLRDKTGSVSRQHLDDACALAFSERLSELCVAIARDAPAPMLASRLAVQLAVGATSGADAAAGLMVALYGCESAAQTC